MVPAYDGKQKCIPKLKILHPKGKEFFRLHFNKFIFHAICMKNNLFIGHNFIQWNKLQIEPLSEMESD